MKKDEIATSQTPRNDDSLTSRNDDSFGGDCCVDAEKRIEELETQNAEYLSGWKRALADYQNLVKESGREKMELVKFANENLILEILPILDNFKLAFRDYHASLPPEAGRRNDEFGSAWVVGFAHIKKQLEDFLKENGVEEIKTVGELFDPLLHEAVERASGKDAKIGTIVEEKRAGYKLRGKVVQAARVAVNE